MNSNPKEDASLMNKKYLYLLSLGHLSVDINSGSLPAVLPFFVAQYGMDYTSVAGLMFASSFLSSIVQPLTGYLADKGSRHWFMVLGIWLAGLSFCATGFVENYWFIFGAVTLMGIGSAIFHPEAARLVNTISGSAKGRGMSIFSVGGNGGFGLGPLVAVFLVTTFGMHGLAFYGVTSLILGGYLLSKLPSLHAEAERMINLPAFPEQNTAQETDNNKAATLVQERQAAAARNDWPAFIRLTLVILFRSTTQSGISSFLPLFCISALGTSEVVGSATLSIMSISGIIATLIGGRLADKWGYVKVLQAGCWLLVPCLAMVAFSSSIWGIYLMLLPISLAIQGPYSSFVVLGQSYLAKNIGFASGITLGLSFSLGGIMMPSLGLYADIYGIASVMPVLCLIALIAAVLTLILPSVLRR